MRQTSTTLLPLLVLCLGAIIVVATTVHAAGGPPPGGRYSTCCNYSDMHACKEHPVDPHFAPNTCKFYEGVTGISCETREYFMHKTLEALMEYENTICPSTPFGAMIVNHTKGPEIEDAEILCIGGAEGADISRAHHGEMVAFIECARILNERFGPGTNHNPHIHQQLTMYAIGEPCAMDSMALRLAKYGEVVWAVSYEEAHVAGWPQAAISSEDVQRATNHCEFGTRWGVLSPDQYGGNPNTGYTSFQTRLIEYVGHDKMLPYFFWKRNPSAPCPPNCARNAGNGQCEPENGISLKTLRQQQIQRKLHQ